MRKRFLAVFLALVMVLGMVPTAAFAAQVTVIASGECGAQGDNVTWTLDSEGTLTISGEGDMRDFGTPSSANNPNIPWKDNMQSITKIKVMAGVTSIGNYACQVAENLCSVEIPDGVTRIGHCAFISCSSLSAMDIPNSVTYIGGGAFANCKNLTEITLPSNLSSIESWTFRECTSLTSITIPSSVGVIEDYVFSGCTLLAEIKVAANNSSFCSSDGVLFDKTMTQLICYPAGKSETSYTIPGSVTSIGEGAFLGCSGLTYVTIPNGVIRIGRNAFLECSSLTSVTIPASVTNNFDEMHQLDGGCQFFGCTSLAEINVDVNNDELASCDGVLFDKSMSRLICYPVGKPEPHYAVPEGVTIIGPFAFDCCSNLTDVTISAGVTTIQKSAFGWCKNLSRVTIPSSVLQISESAFYGLNTLDALSDIYYSGTKKQWSEINIVTGGSVSDLISDAVTVHYASADITYESGGGTGAMDSDIAEKDTPFTLPVCGFTAPAGKEFKAWSINGTEYAPGDTYTITTDTVVTAVWKDVVLPSTGYTLTGTITGHQGVAYTAVTAQLVSLDGTEYPATVTGGSSLDGTTKKECTYSVSAPAGQYNLVVEATTTGGTIVNRTALVKLTGNGQTKDINLPNGQAKSTVTSNKPGTTAIVGGLDNLISDSDLGNNSPVEVALVIENVSESAPGVAAIRSAAPGQTLDFMDVSITKTVGGTASPITDTGGSTIEIILPFSSSGKKNIKVYRYHGNSVETLTEQVSSDGEKIEVANDSITIYAKKFSVYAIGYAANTGSQQPTTPSTPSSGNNGGSSSSGGGGSSISSYNITTPSQVTGGTVKVSPIRAEKGDTVTITVTPQNGYELDKLIATDSKGNKLTITDKGDNKYVFTMPGSKVTVDVSFVAVSTPPVTQINFTDVPSNTWYTDAVAWAAEKGITNGTSKTTFSPDQTCSQIQILTFLWRAAGRPTANVTLPVTVTGVEDYRSAAKWAYSKGMIDAAFRQDTPCTRATAVKFIWQAFGTPAAIGHNCFTDVPAGADYTKAVDWAVVEKIVKGTSKTTFSPTKTCDRAEIVTLLYRAYNK